MGLFSNSKKRLREIQEREERTKIHTIMVVDDEEGNRKTLASLLSESYHVIEAESGDDALTRIRAMENPQSISLIISDHRMPGISGVELLEQVMPLLPQTVRILLTGFADKHAIVDAVRKAKVFKMINKPFERNEFLATVARALEVYELQSR